MALLMFYLTIGCFVSLFTLNELQKEHITGEQILTLAEPKVRLWFQEHPQAYTFVVILSLFVIILIWPYELYRMFNDDNFTFN